MDPRIAALSVHLFTASGAVFAMLSMLAAANHQWSLMFLWLVVAFAVDGIDGPLARRFDVKNYAPRFDGVLLDLIIDYLTYVFIPAFALFQSGLLPGWTVTELANPAYENEHFREVTTKRTPVRRWARPEEFREVGAFLADPSQTFHTGQQVCVDGGYTLF